jgi:hypothetical protein
METQADQVNRIREYLRTQGQKDTAGLTELMQQASGNWSACLAGMSDTQAAFQPTDLEHNPTPYSGEGPRWCVKEVIGHYLASDRGLNTTIAELAGVAPPEATAPPVRAMGIQDPELEALTLDELRGRLADFFNETAALIGRLEGSDAAAGQTFQHPVFGPLAVNEWLAFHQAHAFDHIQQVEQIKQSSGYPPA